MKTPIFVILSFLFVLSCSNSNSQNYQLETQIYDCIKNENLKENKINPDQLIKEIETHLVSEGSLKNTRGEAYLNLINNLVSDENASIYIPK